jgi:hypothetical protein
MKQIILKFNNSIKKTIFKVQNKTNNNFKISNFNKFITISISLLFFYLFYLSIPALYDKTWVQNNIEKWLLKEFKLDFSISSDLSYRILPSPHFLIKDSKLFKNDNGKPNVLADIKNLKVFIGQGNFFDKEKTILKYVKIDKANFSISKSDLKLLAKKSKNNLSSKKIEINDGNIFFKDHLDETVTIIKIKKAFLFADNENLLNLFNLKGEVFNVPFIFDYKKEFDSFNKYKFNITSDTLKLNFFDTYDKDNSKKRKNVSSLLNIKLDTNYKVENGITTFESKDLIIKNTKVDYNGELSIDPFDLILNINIDDYKLLKILNINSVLNELIKTELFFNDSLSIHASITASSNLKREIFQKAKINLNIIKGKINLNKTKLFNTKIGSLELNNGNIYFKDDLIILNTDVIIDINNTNELFSFLQTNKKFRKPINNIFINLDYNFLTNEVDFHNLKINNKKVNDELLRILQVFNGNQLDNFNKNKRLLNSLFKAYEG